MISGKEITVPERLSYGMVGGGQGSLIGDVHRKAAKMDGKIALLSGCFSRDYQNTLRTGNELGLNEERLYRDYQEMAEVEGKREDGIDFVSIVTPNASHYPVAKAFLESGINVVCDKPLTVELKEAEKLARLADANDLIFCVTYTYSGYPMVKQAREMVMNGELGRIQVVMAEYPQEWLITSVENEGNKQAAWRTDPKLAGKSNCVGDIGSHIENTIAYITGLKIKSLCANLDVFGKDRTLDDNASILIKYTNGASGIYWSSQVAIGHDNDLRVRVYGTKGSLEWNQEDPDHLKVCYIDSPVQVLSRGRDSLYRLGEKMVRLPGGHPEGYYESFSNIYSNFAEALLAKKAGKEINLKDFDFPTIDDGIEGVRFIETAVRSSEKGASWLDI